MFSKRLRAEHFLFYHMKIQVRGRIYICPHRLYKLISYFGLHEIQAQPVFSLILILISMKFRPTCTVIYLLIYTYFLEEHALQSMVVLKDA